MLPLPPRPWFGGGGATGRDARAAGGPAGAGVGVRVGTWASSAAERKDWLPFYLPLKTTILLAGHRENLSFQEGFNRKVIRIYNLSWG